RVTAGHRDRPVPSLAPVEVEPGLEERRPTDGERRVARSGARDVVGRLRERYQLAVVVADVQAGAFLELAGTQDEVVQDPASGVLRAGDAHQSRERWRQVDRPDTGHRVAVTDARAGGHE